jgi:hypothetical protein
MKGLLEAVSFTLDIVFAVILWGACVWWAMHAHYDLALLCLILGYLHDIHNAVVKRER